MSDFSIALIIVTYNRLDILKKNLDHIKSQSLKPNHIVIVNNGSEDETIDFLQKATQFDSIHLKENLGFGAGLAEGIDYALLKWRSDFFWLMDDDSFPNPLVLSTLVNTAQDINLNGILGLTGFKIKRGIPRPIYQIDKPILADFVLVDNAFVSQDAFLNAGNFRKDFFMMCEDYEFCFRLKKHGFSVCVLKTDVATVDRLHLGSQMNTFSLIWRGYYHSRNLFLILKDDFTLLNFLYYFHRQAKYLIHSALFGTDKWLRTKFRFVGIWDGLRGVTGKTINPKDLKRIK